MCRILRLTLQKLLWELSTFKQQLLAGRHDHRSKSPQAWTNSTRHNHGPNKLLGRRTEQGTAHRACRNGPVKEAWLLAWVVMLCSDGYNCLFTYWNKSTVINMRDDPGLHRPARIRTETNKKMCHPLWCFPSQQYAQKMNLLDGYFRKCLFI